MSDDWFSYKLAPDGDIEDGCHPEEAQALKDYLRQKTTTAEAAQGITRPITVASNPKEDLTRLWTFLMDALMELPRQHTDALIALLETIEDLPAPRFTATKDKQPFEALWKALPGFGHLWSDMHRSSNWRTLIRASGAERDAFRDDYIRKAEIEARLVRAGLAGIPIDWGYETVADALESSNAVLDIEFPAAAEWLRFCGGRFRLGASAREKSWGLEPHRTMSVDAPSRDLWKAPDDGDMNFERWSFWKDRLRELHTDPRVIEDIRRGTDAMCAGD